MNNASDIPVFLASDDNYAPFLATAMYSVLENTRAAIGFYILDGGITEASKEKIGRSLAAFPHKKIVYFDMSSYGLERFPSVKHYSLNTFSRYFIPELAPQLQKVIYMDVDIIAKRDIAELYREDMGGFPLAAVLEDFYPDNYTALKERIYPDFAAGDKYFNAGVMVMDLQAFRRDNIPEKLISLTLELYGKLNCPDQDIFNIVFENNFKILDYKYNFMPDHIGYMLEKHPKQPLPEPLLIHYTSLKPWKADSLRKADFDAVLAKTEFQAAVREKFQPQTLRRTAKAMLFGFIPLYKIKQKNNIAKHYLFGFIPFLKIWKK